MSSVYSCNKKTLSGIILFIVFEEGFQFQCPMQVRVILRETYSCKIGALASPLCKGLRFFLSYVQFLALQQLVKQMVIMHKAVQLVIAEWFSLVPCNAGSGSFSCRDARREAAEARDSETSPGRRATCKGT